MRFSQLWFVLAWIAALGLGQETSSAQQQPRPDEELRYVIYLSRHGVRSPTGKPAQYTRYSAAPWPEWDVPPGYLTAHGYTLMKLFGAYDREFLAFEGLLTSSGCRDANRIAILADSDQRTRETGKALAEGMFPGCDVKVNALPEGMPDALFHSSKAGVTDADGALAAAAIRGRIGGDVNNLTAAYRLQLTALDHVLAGCGHVSSAAPQRTSIFDVPANLTPGSDDHLVELKSPLNTASTLSENLLLEYTQGMPAENVGWGCVDGTTLRSLMQLHTAATEISQRTPVIARMEASNLLEHILRAMEQHTTGKSVAGAPGKPGDRVLLLVGHDTNISVVAGTLGLTWILDGRRDDSPPGGALVFELWQSRTRGAYSVRVYFTAQTLEQMREVTPLTLSNPPGRVPVFLPGCGRQDLSCPWGGFASSLRQAIDSRYVSLKP